MIENYASSGVNKLKASLNDDFRVIIYDRHMPIVHATDFAISLQVQKTSMQSLFSKMNQLNSKLRSKIGLVNKLCYETYTPLIYCHIILNYHSIFLPLKLTRNGGKLRRYLNLRKSRFLPFNSCNFYNIVWKLKMSNISYFMW